MAHVRQFRFESFYRAVLEHRRLWKQFWNRADISFPGSAELTEFQRFNSYHLAIASPRTERSSVPARTLSGRGYEGHVFWDAEIFVLPFFTLQFPKLARHMLQYRYATLDGARKRARKAGFSGACYAWESTVNGDDVTPSQIIVEGTGAEIPIFTGRQQVHITADVAYGVWNYWFCTHDHEFLENYGAEILFETAEFWMSRSVLRGKTRHIDAVVGPDEYHHDVDDNAFTNAMARFNLHQAAWAQEWLKQRNPALLSRLENRLGISPESSAHWRLAAREISFPGPQGDGVIEQFEGFFSLPDLKDGPGERLKAPVRRLLNWETTNRSRVVKQADVLMLFFLFPDQFDPGVISANFHYYEPLTDHGSSLSPAVHAFVAAQIGLVDKAQSYYRQSVELDLLNLMQNSSLGVHAACMGGSWQALVFGLMGVRLTEQGPRIVEGGSHRIPREWGALSCKLMFRGREYVLEASPDEGTRVREVA